MYLGALSICMYIGTAVTANPPRAAKGPFVHTASYQGTRAWSISDANDTYFERCTASFFFFFFLECEPRKEIARVKEIRPVASMAV
jgi:hypothetical protein